ncbi:ankyrin repeat family protein [Orientia tsutsugamushi str. UT76]|uniref:Ankyrin repeat-containing protein 09 n=1 Tax=Orientia tsutsugamushi TaxID=784 RepID=A0A2U3R2A2_ORITS|nr:ankyrin repeat domain-containing protein [Orientia tsutsugamushi]KJV89019.1 ankyrin repeat family protein [Orientia tsutsugamushi str. UT76]SPR07318.1 ankyrin repeat-containing protein 09 [Orientia tsutsugamushi]
MYNTDLHDAAKQGDINKVKYLILKENRDVNFQDDNKNTPLYCAAKEGRADVVKILLAHGADSSLQCQCTDTALHVATQNKHVDVVKILAAHAAQTTNVVHTDNNNIDLPGNTNQTALHMAVRNESIDIIKILLFYGANGNYSDAFRNTALHVAMIKPNLEIIDLLLTNGCSLNVPNTAGTTPFKKICNSFLNQPTEQKQKIITSCIAHLVMREHCNKEESTTTQPAWFKYNKYLTAESEWFKSNKYLIDKNQSLNEIWQNCQKEIQKMKDTIVCESENTSLFDMFMDSDLDKIARSTNYRHIRHKFEKEFCTYSPFIEKAIESRTLMLQNAVESIDEIFEPNQDDSTSWLHLPLEMKFMVLEYCSKDDLTKLQHYEEVEIAGGNVMHEES